MMQIHPIVVFPVYLSFLPWFFAVCALSGLSANAAGAEVNSSRHGIKIVVPDRWKVGRSGDKDKYVFGTFRDQDHSTNAWWILSKARRAGEDFSAWQKRQAEKVGNFWGGEYKCSVQKPTNTSSIVISGGVSATQSETTMICAARRPLVVHVAYQAQGGKYWGFIAFYPLEGRRAPEEDGIKSILSGIQLRE